MGYYCLFLMAFYFDYFTTVTSSGFPAYSHKTKQSNTSEKERDVLINLLKPKLI
jgi:hypothetical protein